MKRIAIFKTGKHISNAGQTFEATADFIRSVISGYNPKLHEAPVVVGHPHNNEPAYGWVESLSFDETKGILYANFKQLEKGFIKLLKEGRFKKRSASFYPADHPANPTKGKPYLRHVGFLGAQPPAVKGLADFNESKDCIAYTFSESSLNIENICMSNNSNINSSKVTEFAEREALLLAREEAIQRRERELEKDKQESFIDFADGLINEGKIFPAERDAIVSFCMEMDRTEHCFDFSENGVPVTKSGVETLKAMLGRLNTVIEFGELSNSDPNERNLPQNINSSIEASNEKLAQAIKDFAEKHNLDYADAVQQFNGVI